MQESIFTKIIKGDIPCHKVYEDEQTFAFLDIHPVQPGHVLVVPKQQVEFLWDLDVEDYQAVMKTAQKIAQHMREALNVPYVGVKVVGVDVPHAHVHLIPFSTPAEYNAPQQLDAEPDHDTLAQVATKLKIG
jgi:histidine triad (HIT) family protein